MTTLNEARVLADELDDPNLTIIPTGQAAGVIRDLIAMVETAQRELASAYVKAARLDAEHIQERAEAHRAGAEEMRGNAIDAIRRVKHTIGAHDGSSISNALEHAAADIRTISIGENR